MVRELDFKGLFAFKYSPRPGTPALKLGDDVSEDVKSDRLARLFEVSEALLGAHLESLVGTTPRVLVEGPGRDPKTYSGRSDRNAIVHLDGADDLELTGSIVDVVVTRAYKHSVAGELTPAARAAAAPRRPAPKPDRRRLIVVAAEEPEACPS